MTTRTRRILGSAAFVVGVGSLLHFAWEWSGRNPLVAVFAAVNESTWEHLKMAFWPALALAPLQRLLYGPLPGWAPATALRVFLSPAAIVGLFYGYTAIAGSHSLPLDVATFVVAVVLGETVGHRRMERPADTGVKAAALVAILLLALAFAVFTFAPPDAFLFADPGRDAL